MSVLAAVTSCETGTGGGENVNEISITLSSAPKSILADGSSVAEFTVIENSTLEDVTSSAVIRLVSADGEQVLESPQFSTDVPGTYTFYAEYRDVTSPEISVTAADPANLAGTVLHVSKESIYSDGGDFSVLTLVNADGEDITDLGTFYANGEVLEGNRFSTTVSSLRPVQITAEISGIQVGEAVSIMASDRYAFTPRALLEEITRTSCVNCPTDDQGHRAPVCRRASDSHRIQCPQCRRCL